jgi:hypothetical protein
MTDPRHLRKALVDFLGEDRFAKFVRQGIRPRLKFWQEKEWDAFNAANPDMAPNLDDLEIALRFCEVHRQELQPCSVETFDGCIVLGQDYLQARATLFPYAAVDRVMVPAGTAQHIPSWYCPMCRTKAAEWRGERA